jgi:hypothetical protein
MIPRIVGQFAKQADTARKMSGFWRNLTYGHGSYPKSIAMLMDKVFLGASAPRRFKMSVQG